MRIAVVGGISRNEVDYQRVAESSGHEIVFHSGYVGGRGSETLTELVAHVDLVIVITDVNSHGAVQLARRVARKRGTPLEIHRRFGPARLASRLAPVADRAR